MINLLKGDNIQLLKTLEDNSIDSVVTDPPYGLNFMNKKWDYQVPTVEFWKEVYRVLKPGGHVLSFGGTRTYHRMVVNIEDAGFEIRDQLQWLYGSGFPKSLNIRKAVDKIQGNEREIVGERIADDITGGNLLTSKPDKIINITKGNSPYEGWGTGLKPSNEPICLARKPISEKTVALNVLKWGTGGINIDGCRIEFKDEKDFKSSIFGTQPRITSKGAGSEGGTFQGYNQGVNAKNIEPNKLGRFPSNLILGEDAAEELDRQSGVSKSNHSKLTLPKSGTYAGGGEGLKEDVYTERGHNDSGGASRFFYVAKVSRTERNSGLDGFENVKRSSLQSRIDNSDRFTTITKNVHPTVKPIKLMTYLVRLITPKDGIVLDPFMGSGSTGMAAKSEGFKFVGMEMDEEYFKIAEARIKNYEK